MIRQLLSDRERSGLRGPVKSVTDDWSTTEFDRAGKILEWSGNTSHGRVSSPKVGIAGLPLVACSRRPVPFFHCQNRTTVSPLAVRHSSTFASRGHRSQRRRFLSRKSITYLMASNSTPRSATVIAALNGTIGFFLGI